MAAQTSETLARGFHFWTIALIAAMFATLLVAFAPSVSPASAALSGSSFQRGDIISDYLFFQHNAMTQAQIQDFLDAECPTNNCINVIKSPSTTETSNAECPGGYTAVAS